MRQSSHILSLQFMPRVLFGNIESDRCRQIVGLFRDEILQDLGTWSPWRRFGQAQKPGPKRSQRNHLRRTLPGPQADLVNILSHAAMRKGRCEDDESTTMSSRC